MGNFFIWDMPIVYVSCYLIIGLCASTLIKMVNDEVSELFHKPIFWISSALLLYFTSTLIVWGLFNRSENLENVHFMKNVYNIHSVI
ncbi:MAG: hypothetical protein WAR77_03825, partial [Saprospiraceae bacterium]